MVNYDINDPPNGVGLPTVGNNIVYTVVWSRAAEVRQVRRT